MTENKRDTNIEKRGIVHDLAVAVAGAGGLTGGAANAWVKSKLERPDSGAQKPPPQGEGPKSEGD